MSYSYEQIGTVCATFACADNLEVGNVCIVTGNGTVSHCQGDDIFMGVVTSKRDGCAAVTVRGFVTVPYTGMDPICGYTPLAADGNGNLMASDGSYFYHVVHVDTVNKTVTFLL